MKKNTENLYLKFKREKLKERTTNSKQRTTNSNKIKKLMYFGIQNKK